MSADDSATHEIEQRPWRGDSVHEPLLKLFDPTPACLLCGERAYLVPFPLTSIHYRKWICGSCLDRLVDVHMAAVTVPT